MDQKAFFGKYASATITHFELHALEKESYAMNILVGDETLALYAIHTPSLDSAEEWVYEHAILVKIIRIDTVTQLITFRAVDQANAFPGVKMAGQFEMRYDNYEESHLVLSRQHEHMWRFTDDEPFDENGRWLPWLESDPAIA